MTLIRTISNQSGRLDADLYDDWLFNVENLDEAWNNYTEHGFPAINRNRQHNHFDMAINDSNGSGKAVFPSSNLWRLLQFLFLKLL